LKPRGAIRLMVDLTPEMAQLWGALGAVPAGQARVIQFVAARTGEGTSTVAREFARYASRRVRTSVWLVDLDLMDSPQHKAIAEDEGRYGALGRQSAASPDGSAFFTVQPPARGPDGRPWPDARFLVAHAVGGANLWVTRFRREILQAGQRVSVLPTGDYWRALRKHAEIVVIDAPAADRSGAAMATAPFADATVLVVGADEGDAAGPAALRDAITAAGGRCAGLVFNRSQAEPPPFLKAILG
jgi:Mrp family chromosome partitioning ATPase